MFCAAVAYARYTYIKDDEFNPEIKRTVFEKLHQYWENNYKDKRKFPRSDMFYVTSARMLMYYGHYTWKFEKNEWAKAKELLKRGLKGMEKVKFGASLIKQDLKYQIEEMEETIKQKDIPREQRFAGIWCLNAKKTVGDETTTQKEPMKKPPVPAKKNTKSQFSLLDMISDKEETSGSFQIHGDDDGASVVTPNVKKSSRLKSKRIDDTPARTPSARTKPHGTDSVTKTSERSARSKRVPNHLVPKITYDLTESSPEIQELPETPAPRSTKKQTNVELAPRKPRVAANKTARKAASGADETWRSKN